MIFNYDELEDGNLNSEKYEEFGIENKAVLMNIGDIFITLLKGFFLAAIFVALKGLLLYISTMKDYYN